MIPNSLHPVAITKMYLGFPKYLNRYKKSLYIYLIYIIFCFFGPHLYGQTIPAPSANSFSALSQGALLVQPSYYDYKWVFDSVPAHASPDPYPAPYECVDYCDRWLNQWYGASVANAINGHAQTWMLDSATNPSTTKAVAAGLSTFYNGGADRPQKGDIVVFEGTDKVGHVAVLKEYKPSWTGWDGEPGYALLAQQNVCQGNDDYHFRIKGTSGNTVFDDTGFPQKI